MSQNLTTFLLILPLLISLSNCNNNHQPSQEEALLQAYLATDYQVYPTPSQTLHIRVNQINSEVDYFLDEHQSWAYITAWNPNSQLLPAAENKQRNQVLAKTLASKGFTFYKGKGVPDEGDWLPEVSFLVIDISKEAAIKIGQDYGQKAIVWGQVGLPATLVFCMPK